MLEKVYCREKLIVTHFEDALNTKCEKCDNRLKTVIHVTKDHTANAKVLVTCLQHLIPFKDKVTVEVLSLTFMCSQAAEIKGSKLDQVLEYGKGKGHFKSLSDVIGLINDLITEGIFEENLRFTDDRAKSSYLTVGKVK